MHFPTRVVAIDNQVRELAQIERALSAARIPAIGVLYDPVEGIAADIAPLCRDARLVLTDLNLLDSGVPEPDKIAAVIADALESLGLNGPYVLVFWSKHPDIVDSVVALLRSNRYSERVRAPLKHAILEKQMFDVDAAKSDLEKQQQVDLLVTKLKGLFSDLPALEALLMWESNVSHAACAVSSKLCQELSGAAWNAPDSNDRVSALLTTISHQTIGRAIAKTQPTDSIEIGLNHLLGDECGRIGDRDVRDQAWRRAMPRLGDKLAPPEPLTAEKLNTMFNVDSSGLVDSSMRGSVCEIAQEWLSDDRMKDLCGLKLNSTLAEFLNFADDIGPAVKQQVRSSVRLCLVELSAACDYAQEKQRTRRYALAAMIPKSFEEYTIFGGDKPRPTKHQGVYRLAEIHLDGQSWIIKLNFLQILGLPKEAPAIGRALFRIRSPMIDDIAFRCSSHLARPGIVSF